MACGMALTRPSAARKARAAPLPRGYGEPAPVSAVAEAARPQRTRANYQGFVEPQPWPDDRGRRRERVLDGDPDPSPFGVCPTPLRFAICISVKIALG